jgi:hypothetical protein
VVERDELGHELGTIMNAMVAAVVLWFVLAVPAWAAPKPVVLTVDARNHCMGLADGTTGQVTATLPSGRYRVTLDANASYCEGGCPVDKVVFYITTDDQPKGWFYVAARGEPIHITVSGQGFEANTVRAFFLDALCGDNSGRAVLSFWPTRPPATDSGRGPRR